MPKLKSPLVSPKGTALPDTLQLLAATVIMRLGRWLLHLFISFKKVAQVLSHV
jgi:hypothetical protein